MRARTSWKAITLMSQLLQSDLSIQILVQRWSQQFAPAMRTSWRGTRTEAKVKENLRSTGELWRKGCAELKEFEYALIRAEIIPLHPLLRTPSRSISRRQEISMGAVSKLKHRLQDRPKLEIVQNYLPALPSYYFYMFLKVPIKFVQLFVSKACPSSWFQFATLRSWFPHEKDTNIPMIWDWRGPFFS